MVSSTLFSLYEAIFLMFSQVLVSRNVSVRQFTGIDLIGCKRIHQGERRPGPRRKQQQHVHALREPDLAVRNPYLVEQHCSIGFRRRHHSKQTLTVTI